MKTQNKQEQEWPLCEPNHDPPSASPTTSMTTQHYTIWKIDENSRLTMVGHQSGASTYRFWSARSLRGTLVQEERVNHRWQGPTAQQLPLLRGSTLIQVDSVQKYRNFVVF